MVSFKNLFICTILLTQVQCISILLKALSAIKPQEVSISQKLFSFNRYSIDNLPGGDNTKPVPGDSPIEICDFKESQLLKLQEIIIAPNPPKAGSNLTFTATGYISKTIEDGAYVEVDVRYGFIKLVHQTFDLCEEVQKVDLECPIQKGNQIISKVVEIPQEVPPGKYLVNARAYTKDDEYITCLTAQIEFPIQ
ncbi:unnamed protein product [Candida verbasci]|uniref:Phosphatidylglycerol/phosphatidylinositol transfer protein n=1 Tax=Candida verbasci TaxID=1227364 RepID=A0A9W4XB41_9ASCO|nr:unnamed protein product [Candida verbasci]